MSKSMSLSWAGILLLHLTHFLALLSILSLVLNQTDDHSPCHAVGITGQHSPDGSFRGDADGTS